MGVLLMLMTIAGLVIAIVVLVGAIVTKKTWLRNFVLGGVAIWIVFYAAMLLGFSLTSVEKTLGLNEAKEYCGFYFDCHMHTAVTGVRTAARIGDRAANGQFYVVRVKVFSDARREPLALITVDARVVDNLGRIYVRDTGAEENLAAQPSFETQISPSESFEKEIVFDLPAEAVFPRLDIREGYGIDHVIEALLIGDEDSICHKRQFFEIQEQKETAGVK